MTKVSTHFLAILVGGIGFIAAAEAQVPVDKSRFQRQIDKENDVQREVDLVVRRIAAMMSILEFYGIESTERTKLLEDAGRTLSRLSREQMNEVIARLDAAARTDDRKQSKQEADEAYRKHTEIMMILRTMMDAMASLRSLEQAAQALEKLAVDQQNVHVLTNRVIRLTEEKSAQKGKPLTGSKARDLQQSGVLQHEFQAQVERGIHRVLGGIKSLMPGLSAEQQQRVRAMEKRLAEMDLLKHAALVGQKLVAPGTAEWSRANKLQNEIAVNLLELAQILLSHSSNDQILKDAVKRLDKAIVRQDDLARQTREQHDKLQSLARAEEKAKKAFPPPPPGTHDQLIMEIKEALDGFAMKTRDNPQLAQQFQSVERQLQDELNHLVQVQERLNPELFQKNLKKQAGERQRAEEKRSVVEKLSELAQAQSRLELTASGIREQIDPIAKEQAGDLVHAEEDMQSARNALDRGEPTGAAPGQKKASEELRQVRDDLEKRLAREQKDRGNPLIQLRNLAKELDRVIEAQQETRAETRNSVGPGPADLAKKQQNLAERGARLREKPFTAQPSLGAALDQAKQAMNKAADDLKAKNPLAAVLKQDLALRALQQARKDVNGRIAHTEKRQEDLARIENALKEPGISKQARADLVKELAKLQAEQIKDQVAMQPGKIDPRQARDQIAQALKEARDANRAILKAGKEAAGLAQEQKNLKSLSEALARAKEKTEDAQSALGQVPPAPDAIQKQLKEANENLQNSKNELAQGKPEEAAKSQARAEESLEWAMNALNEATRDGQDFAKSDRLAKSGEPLVPRGEKTRTAGKPGQSGKKVDNDAGRDGAAKDSPAGPAGAARLKEITGDSSFLALPPREREMIRQAMTGSLPPEYAAEIQQYFANIARGRAAPAVPMAPGLR